MLPISMRILCVDDDETTRSTLTELLRILTNYDIIGVNTASEALHLARSERFSLYILDYRLPDDTGLNLCHKLRILDPQALIIFFSGETAEFNQLEGLRAGAQACIAKPRLNELTETVHLLLLDRKKLAAKSQPHY